MESRRELMSHSKALAHLQTTLATVISLLYDSYLLCYHHLLKRDKLKVGVDETESGNRMEWAG